MKIKFIISVGGPRFSANNGDIRDVEDRLARQFIAAGQAIPLRNGDVETTQQVFPGVEAAVINSDNWTGAAGTGSRFSDVVKNAKDRIKGRRGGK
jgi:hypothetical protein